MLTSNVCEILSISESCFHPQTIVSMPTYCTRVTLIVNFSDASDKTAIKKSEVRYKMYQFFWVDFLLYILAKQLRQCQND